MKWTWLIGCLLIIGCTKKQTNTNVANKNIPTKADSTLVESLVKVLNENVAIRLRDSLNTSILADENSSSNLDDSINSNPEFSEITPTTDGTDAGPNGVIIHDGGYVDEPPVDIPGKATLDEYYGKAFKDNTDYLTDGFDFPVGRPNMRGYYIAQKYLQNRHLGDDFNAVTGGNTDLGDPVYATANGIVTFSHDLEGGWGNTIRIVHRHPVGDMVETLYSHLDERHVNFGQFVKRGDLIGTIGTAHGLYPAHLHFEVRTMVNMPLGRGYSDHAAPPGYTAPTPFIRRNRPEAPRW